VAHRPESIGPTAFEPETINILSAALDEAWYQVEGDKACPYRKSNPDILMMQST
jgi:hypothetical protein